MELINPCTFDLCEAILWFLMSFGIFYDFSLGAKIPTGVHEEDKDTKPVYIFLFGSIEFVCVFCRRVCF